MQARISAIGHVTEALLVQQEIPVRIVNISYADNNDPCLDITLCESLPDNNFIQEFITRINNMSGYIITWDNIASIAYNTGYTTITLHIHL